MQRKYSVTTRLLVVLASAITGYSLAMLFNGQFKFFGIWICAAIVIFGIAVAIAYKKHKSSLVGTTDTPVATVQESAENDENAVDEAEFEEKDVTTEPVYTEIKTPEDNDDKDVVNEFQ